MSFDPTKMITTPDQAVTAANTMMQMSAVGMGSGVDSVSDAGIWESNTEGPLAAMLFAAAQNGEGMDWVLLAVDNMEWDEDTATHRTGLAAGGHSRSGQTAVLQRTAPHAGYGSQAARQHRVDHA